MMALLTKDDYCEIYLDSMLASYDRDTLMLLYQPIVGAKAISIYFTLWSQYKLKSTSELVSHEYLLKLSELNLDEFEVARHKLEAIGLIKTFYKHNENMVCYCYILSAPKTPGDFLDDPLFSTLYRSKVGEKTYSRTKMFFTSLNPDLEGYKDTTKSFGEIYGELDKEMTDKYRGFTKGRKRAVRDISSGFDHAKFDNEIEAIHFINKNSIFKDDHEEIARIALLFGLSERVMADLVAMSYDKDKKPHIDFDRVQYLARNEGMIPVKFEIKNGEEQYGDDTKLAKKMQLMTSTSPYDYLKFKQNNTTPSTADLSLINDLSSKQGLCPSVINALVDYVLERQNNTLPRKYTEKIAASLQRESIDNARDAMNYLYAQNKRRKTNKSFISQVEAQENNNEVSDEEFERLKKALGEL